MVDKYQISKGLTAKQLDAIYYHSLVEGRLHVQTFINDVRGQMNKLREDLTIKLFNRIQGFQEKVDLDFLRKQFRAKFFRWGEYRDDAEVREMFDYVLDLFACLNLTIKSTDVFSLDDFLYLFDNFSFGFEEDKDYEEFLQNCFY